MITLQIAIGITYVLLAINLNFQKQINRNLMAKISRLENDRAIVHQLVHEETRRKIAHTQVFENLTDPDKIHDELERSADIIEARQANRLHAPRPDAGPPAKVFKPRFVGKRASYWKPPRV